MGDFYLIKSHFSGMVLKTIFRNGTIGPKQNHFYSSHSYFSEDLGPITVLSEMNECTQSTRSSQNQTLFVCFYDMTFYIVFKNHGIASRVLVVILLSK